MGSLSEFTLPVRAFLRAYRWWRIDPVPWSEPSLPLSRCRVGLITTAGLIAEGQEPFDHRVKSGDTTYRVIDSDIPPDRLVESHRSRSFDRSGMELDRNLVFPIDRLREMAKRGRIGSVNHRHFSFMGSITAPGPLVRESAPAVATAFVEDHVDVVLLVPV